MEAEAEVIMVGNQRGGVCKTSTVLGVAAALGEQGHSVLVWDWDGNRGSTIALGALSPDPRVKQPDWKGTFQVLLGEATPEQVILRNGEDGMAFPLGVELLPAQERLERLERDFLPLGGARLLDAIVGPLAKLRSLYDYILIDTPPRGGAWTEGPMLHADWVVVTTTPEPLPFAGVGTSTDYLRAARETGRSQARFLGLVVSKVPGRGLNREYQKLAKEFDAFEAMIPLTAEIPNAQRHGQTVLQAKPDHKASHAYRALAREWCDRIELARREDDEEEKGDG